MIERIQNAQQLKNYEPELIAMYHQCFAEPPWHEVFTDEEVIAWFYDMLSYNPHIICVFVEDKTVQGATFNFPMAYKQDVLLFLPSEAPADKTLYLAETFVSPHYRRRGIASQLHNERIKIAIKEGFRYAVQRTHRKSNMFPLMQKQGFAVIGEEEVMSKKRYNGVIETRPDPRVISFKKL